MSIFRTLLHSAPSESRARPNLLFMLALVAFATAKPACAYTDPGSGALMWQLLVAGFVGSMFYIRRIRSWASNWKKNRSAK